MLNGHTLKAGLLDRGTSLMSTACLASHLCARVAVMPPCAMLTEDHLDGQPLSCDVKWDRYFNITRKSSGEPLLTVHSSLSTPDLSNQLSLSGTDFITITPSSDIGGEFALALRSHVMGQSFLWQLSWHTYTQPVNYEAMKDLRVSARQLGVRLWDPNAPPIRISWSSTVLQMRESFFARHGFDAGRFITLHVRRGDAIDECNTSAAHVANYVACVLDNEGRRESAEPLLLFTDEEDSGYLQQLQDLLSRLTVHDVIGSPRRVVHGDALLQLMLADASESRHDAGDLSSDNYLVFAVGRAVQEAAASAIEIRSKYHTGSQRDCRDSCVPIAAAAERYPPSKLDRPLPDWGCMGAY